MSKLLVVLAVVIVVAVLHWLLSKGRGRILTEANAAIDRFPRPGEGHCPGDGAIKGRIHGDAVRGIFWIWVLEIVLALLIAGAAYYRFPL